MYRLLPALVLLLPACAWSDASYGTWGPTTIEADGGDELGVTTTTTALDAGQANVLNLRLVAQSESPAQLVATFTATAGDPLEVPLEVDGRAELHWTSGQLYGDCAESACSDTTEVSLRAYDAAVTVTVEAEYTVDGGESEPEIAVDIGILQAIEE